LFQNRASFKLAGCLLELGRCLGSSRMIQVRQVQQ
jgi:hypothetical protein